MKSGRGKKRKLGFLLFAMSFASPVGAEWDHPASWSVGTDGKSTLRLSEGDGRSDAALKAEFKLAGGGWSWAEMSRDLDADADLGRPFVFWAKSRAQGQLEVKWVDEDGSTFLAKFLLEKEPGEWTRRVLYPLNMEYVWGGDDRPGRPKHFRIAFSGESGGGEVLMDGFGFGEKGEAETPSPFSPQIDPRADAPGIGFAQRRASAMAPEDPLVLEWLKAAQDASSPDGKLLASMGDNVAQTFNNALAAIAFVLKGERGRAERILDFFAEAMNPDNDDPTLQNFYYRGEARGFYQSVILPSTKGGPYRAMSGSDRWMGDMSWLLIAYQFYSREYDLHRYGPITRALTELHKEFFKPAGVGGYVQHGWRNMDKQKHETFGHGEINVDAYSALNLSGEPALAAQVRLWLSRELKGNSLPLDLYTWRVLSLGKEEKDALLVPERDLRFRKTISVNGRRVTGFIDRAQPFVENLWLDGLGHMACAYFFLGDFPRGNFYANQYDALLIPQTVGGKAVKSIPYTVNKDGGYEWVDLEKGFVSTACWYIFAKNRFNPMRLEQARP